MCQMLKYIKDSKNTWRTASTRSSNKYFSVTHPSILKKRWIGENQIWWRTQTNSLNSKAKLIGLASISLNRSQNQMKVPTSYNKSKKKKKLEGKRLNSHLRYWNQIRALIWSRSRYGWIRPNGTNNLLVLKLSK